MLSPHVNPYYFYFFLFLKIYQNMGKKLGNNKHKSRLII
jgi:hypothetical protein